MTLKDNNGFTLIEVLLAMVIFLIGFLAVGSMQIAAVNANTNSRLRTSATILAGDVAEQLLHCPYDSRFCSVEREPYTEDDPFEVGAHPGPTASSFFPAEDPDGSGPDGSYEVRWFVTELEPKPGQKYKQIDLFVRWQKKGSNNSIEYTFVKADASL